MPPIVDLASHATQLATCVSSIACRGASVCLWQKSKWRRIVLLYVGDVLGAHGADRRAGVFAPNTLEFVIMYGFIVSIHELMLVVTLTPYLGLVGRPGR